MLHRNILVDLGLLRAFSFVFELEFVSIVLRWWWWIEAIGMHSSAVFDQMPWIIVVKMALLSSSPMCFAVKIKQVSRFIQYLSQIVQLTMVCFRRGQRCLSPYLSLFFSSPFLCRFNRFFSLQRIEYAGNLIYTPFFIQLANKLLFFHQPELLDSLTNSLFIHTHYLQLRTIL